VILWNPVYIVENVHVFLELDIVVVTASNYWHVCFVVNKCCMRYWIILPQSPNSLVLYSLRLSLLLIRHFPANLPCLNIRLLPHIKRGFVFPIVLVLNTLKNMIKIVLFITWFLRIFLLYLHRNGLCFQLELGLEIGLVRAKFHRNLIGFSNTDLPDYYSATHSSFSFSTSSALNPPLFSALDSQELSFSHPCSLD